MYLSFIFVFAEMEVGWNEAESTYGTYKFTHQIFTESDAILALTESLCIAESAQLGATLLHILNMHISQSSPPSMGFYTKIFHRDPYEGPACSCISNSRSTYLLIERSTIQCNLIITKFASYLII